MTTDAVLTSSAQGWLTALARPCLTGILFVLRSGIPWEMLTRELGCGSGMTCWRRLRDWQAAGVWRLIHVVLLSWLARYGQIDWPRAVVDGSLGRAVFGAQTGSMGAIASLPKYRQKQKR